jgi:hypothetical protein
MDVNRLLAATKQTSIYRPIDSLQSLCLKSIGKYKDKYSSFKELRTATRRKLYNYFQERYLLENEQDLFKFLDPQIKHLELKEHYLTDNILLQASEHVT